MFDLQFLDNRDTDHQIVGLGRELRDLASFWIQKKHWPLLAKHLQDDSYLEFPKLPQVEGACWIIFVLQEEHLVLESGIVLPLQWFRDPPAESRIPQNVGVLAEEVLDFARESQLIGHSDPFFLDFPKDWDCPNLSRLHEKMDVKANSGFTPLLTGLRQLVKGDLPSLTVWSTGQYFKESGITSVGDIETKIKTAERWEASSLFVPEANNTKENSDLAKEHGVILETLPFRSSAELLGSLGGLFAASLSRPDMSRYADRPLEAIEHAAQFHVKVAELDRNEAKQWYIKEILPLLPEMCRKKLAECEIATSPTHLITVASQNPETIRTTVATFQIKNCLILHTPDMVKKAQQAEEYCLDLKEEEGLSCNVKLKTIDLKYGVNNQRQHRKQLTEEFRNAVDAFIQSCRKPEDLAIDLTPGFTTFKVVLLEAIAQEKNILVYMQHRSTEGIVEHGSEEFVVWQKGDDWRRAADI